MTTEQVFYLMGLISGGGAMWAGMVLFQWFVERRPKPVNLDDRWAAVRHINARPMTSEEVLEHLRKANREGLL